jgi:hypothetical protein
VTDVLQGQALYRPELVITPTIINSNISDQLCHSQHSHALTEHVIMLAVEKVGTPLPLPHRRSVMDPRLRQDSKLVCQECLGPSSYSTLMHI